MMMVVVDGTMTIRSEWYRRFRDRRLVLFFSKWKLWVRTQSLGYSEKL